MKNRHLRQSRARARERKDPVAAYTAYPVITDLGGLLRVPVGRISGGEFAAPRPCRQPGVWQGGGFRHIEWRSRAPVRELALSRGPGIGRGLIGRNGVRRWSKPLNPKAREAAEAQKALARLATN